MKDKNPVPKDIKDKHPEIVDMKTYSKRRACYGCLPCCTVTGFSTLNTVEIAFDDEDGNRAYAMAAKTVNENDFDVFVSRKSYVITPCLNYGNRTYDSYYRWDVTDSNDKKAKHREASKEGNLNIVLLMEEIFGNIYPEK